MQQNGGDYKEAMTDAINAAKARAAVEAVAKVLGTFIGYAGSVFLIPFLVVYAWNGLTPEGWVDLSYLPAVAGLFAFRIMILWVRPKNDG